MRNLLLTSKNVTITKDSAKKTESDKPFYPQQKPPLLNITAKVSPRKISYLLDTFICSEVIPQDDGSVTAAFTVPDFDWIYEILLSFGVDMKILSPESVKEKVIKRAEDLLKTYNQL